MRKTLRTLGIALALTTMAALPSFAGTMQQNGTALQYLKDDGSYAKEEWIQVGSDYYYFDKEGNSVAGWKRVNKKWYYLDPATGKMKTGWLQNTDGNWYYLDDTTGEMLSKTRTPDGFWVEKNGKYNPEKGNIYDDKKGPGAAADAKKRETILKGVVFPDLTAFATDNLATEAWGIEGSMEALTAMGANVVADLKSQGVEVANDTVFYVDGTSITYATEGPEKPLFKLTKNGDHYELAVYGNIDNVEVANDTVFYVDGTSITYATEGPEKPLFKLTKNGDHYELAVYGNIDKNMETPLFALSSMISSTPQAIYNAMYTVAQYDRTIMAQDYYKELGGSDVQITYTIVGDYDYFYYSIKQK